MQAALYNHRIRDNSIITSCIGVKNFRSIVIVAENMVGEYVSSPNKPLIRKCILRILTSVKYKYSCLPTEIKTTKEVADLIHGLKKSLKSAELMSDIDIRRFLSEFSMPRLTRRILRVWSILKNRLKFKNSDEDIKCVITQLINSKSEKRIIFACTPEHGNIGDHAIAVAQFEMFKDFCPDYEVVEITAPIFRKGFGELKEYIRHNDIIAISGGGWLGTVWFHEEELAREIIKSFNNKIFIFPQTVYFGNTEKDLKELQISSDIYSNHNKLVFSLRDKTSYEFVLKNNFIKKPDNCLYLPDAVLYMNLNIEISERSGVLLCFRTDKEKVLSYKEIEAVKNCLRNMGESIKYTTTIHPEDISISDRDELVYAKLSEFKSAKLIITDRLHAMLFAAITGTPCIAFDNLTKKVSGVYEWIKDLDYIKCVKRVDEIDSLVKELLKMESIQYSNAEVKKHFKRIFDMF